VTPGQVVKYVVALSKQSRPAPPIAGGPPALPVQPLNPTAVIAPTQRIISPPAPPPMPPTPPTVEPPQSGIGI
jgi:hypothetical protein